MKSWIRKKGGIYLGIILILTLLMPINIKAAQAKSNIDPDHQAGAVFHYVPGQTTIKIYKIANITSQSRFTVIAPFDGEPFNQITQIQEINGLDADGYSRLASTLKTYIDIQNTEPTVTVETDEKGYGTKEDLGTGMFLAIPEDTQDYEAQPALFSLPGLLGEDGEWVYTMDVEIKYTEIEHQTTNVKVIKVWDDSNNKNECRPDSIEVTLRGDKKDLETVELNEENSWQYEWSGLEDGIKYTVVESAVPDNYLMDNTEETNKETGAKTITLTNTYDGEKTPEPTTGGSGGGNGGTTQASTKSTTLPKTGQLWWPVPFLCIGGMAAFLVGVIRRKRWEKDHIR